MVEKLIISTSDGDKVGIIERKNQGRLNLNYNNPKESQNGGKLKQALDRILSEDHLFLRIGRERKAGEQIRYTVLGKKCSKNDLRYLDAVGYELRRRYGFRSERIYE